MTRAGALLVVRIVGALVAAACLSSAPGCSDDDSPKAPGDKEQPSSASVPAGAEPSAGRPRSETAGPWIASTRRKGRSPVITRNVFDCADGAVFIDLDRTAKTTLSWEIESHLAALGCGEKYLYDYRMQNMNGVLLLVRKTADPPSWDVASVITMKTDRPLGDFLPTTDKRMRRKTLAGMEYVHIRRATQFVHGKVVVDSYTAKIRPRTYLVSTDHLLFRRYMDSLKDNGGLDPSVKAVLDEIGTMDYWVAGKEAETIKQWDAWFPQGARFVGQGYEFSSAVQCRGLFVFASSDRAGEIQERIISNIAHLDLSGKMKVTRAGNLLRVSRILTMDEYCRFQARKRLRRILKGAAR